MRLICDLEIGDSACAELQVAATRLEQIAKALRSASNALDFGEQAEVARIRDGGTTVAHAFLVDV